MASRLPAYTRRVMRGGSQQLMADGAPGTGAGPVALHFAPGRAIGLAALHIGVPLFFTVYAGASNWKLVQAEGLWATLWFYALHVVLTWPVTALLTWAAWRVLRPLQPGLVPLTLLGSLLGCLVTVTYIDEITRLLPSAVDMWGSGPVDWARIAGSMAKTTTIWVGANWVFDRFLGLPRYRYPPPDTGLQAPGASATPASLPAAGAEPAAPAAPGAPPPISTGRLPAFLGRLSRPVDLETLLAIHAEQHYIQVISAAGRELVLYRLSDAIRELPPELGVQVHRSWWVSRAAVAEITGCGSRKLTLTLRNGQEVPVSAPYQALAKTVLGFQGQP